MNMTIEQEVLNAACDDWESLDQIFLSVRFEYVSELYNPEKPTSHCWRERNPSITLGEIVAAIQDLAKRRLMEVRREDRSSTTTVTCDDVVRGWSRTTELGRSTLQAITSEQ